MYIADAVTDCALDQAIDQIDHRTGAGHLIDPRVIFLGQLNQLDIGGHVFHHLGGEFIATVGVDLMLEDIFPLNQYQAQFAI